MKSLFTAANRHLDSEVNVEKLFGGIRFRDDVPKTKERKPWTVDDLNRLFATGGPQGKFGYQYSQDFTVYRRQTGLYEDLRDFHSFRHTFATHLCRAIKDILMVGEIVGHETQQIETQTYTHPTVADRYAAICKLDYVAEGLEIGHLFPRPSNVG